MGKIDLTNEWRRPAGRRIALVGDAALAADPVGAIGCGWAFQSAEWLADALTPALAGKQTLDRALRQYRRRHRHELLGHYLATSRFALAKPLSPLERLMFSAATHDPQLAAHTDAFAARLIRPRQFLSPNALTRAARVNLTDRLQRAPETAASA